MTLTECKKILAAKAVSDEHFLKLHFCVEAIYRRLFFIGLRKQGVYYKAASKIAKNYYNSDRQKYVNTIFSYCEIDLKGLKSNKKFSDLLNLYIKYSSCYRNERVHGVINEINDKELLQSLIFIDKNLIEELLKFLKTTVNLDIFDKPSKWNIPRGNQADTDKIFNELYEKGLPENRKYTKEQAAEIINKLS